jgi:hypothetical protein
VKYGDFTGICTLWLGDNVYPMFQNYRPYSTSFPTADLYVGGLITGPTQSDVTVP